MIDTRLFGQRRNRLRVFLLAYAAAKDAAAWIYTGRFSEAMTIRGEKDPQAFLKQYGITEIEIRKEWQVCR